MTLHGFPQLRFDFLGEYFLAAVLADRDFNVAGKMRYEAIVEANRIPVIDCMRHDACLTAVAASPGKRPIGCPMPLRLQYLFVREHGRCPPRSRVDRIRTAGNREAASLCTRARPQPLVEGRNETRVRLTAQVWSYELRRCSHLKRQTHALTNQEHPYGCRAFGESSGGTIPIS